MVATKRSREGRGNQSFVRFPGFLRGKQLERARAFVHSQPVQHMIDEGELFNHDEKDKSRKSRIAWIERRSDDCSPTVPPWLHAKLRRAAHATHRVYGDRVAKVGVDKRGRWTPRFEPMQYAEYGPGAHYSGWHTDAEQPELDPEDARCLTVVVMLADPESFEGGHFQARVEGRRASNIKLAEGEAIGFLSKHLWHRVTPVSSGQREVRPTAARPPAHLAASSASGHDARLNPDAPCPLGSLSSSGRGTTTRRLRRATSDQAMMLSRTRKRPRHREARVAVQARIWGYGTRTRLRSSTPVCADRGSEEQFQELLFRSCFHLARRSEPRDLM